MAAAVGFVVIGRNEGARLPRCLASIDAPLSHVVYVDSGSTDDSLVVAGRQGIPVVELSAELPFTAARARNAGFRRLCQLAASISYVQFVDGDTELCAGWIAGATEFLDKHPNVAAVTGRLRERHPEQSIYNRLCEMEWDIPAGEVTACGGNVLMRREALEQAGGFRDELIAGEEPELCFRLRRAGWLIWSLGVDMAMHDASMTRFAQWWRRAYRGGHAFAEAAYLHRAGREGLWREETQRIWMWGFWLPIIVLLSLTVVGEPGMLLLTLYPLQVLRLAIRGTGRKRDKWWRALFFVIGKFPEALGQARFCVNRRLGTRSGLIEYK